MRRFRHRVSSGPSAGDAAVSIVDGVHAVHQGDSVITEFGVFEQTSPRGSEVARNPRYRRTVKVKPTSVPGVPPGPRNSKRFVSGAQHLGRRTRCLSVVWGPVQPEGSEEAPAKKATKAARKATKAPAGKAATKAPAKRRPRPAKRKLSGPRESPRQKVTKAVKTAVKASVRKATKAPAKKTLGKRPATKAPQESRSAGSQIGQRHGLLARWQCDEGIRVCDPTLAASARRCGQPSQACRLSAKRQHPRAALRLRDLSGCCVALAPPRDQMTLPCVQITGVPTCSTICSGVGRVWGCWRRTLRSRSGLVVYGHVQFRGEWLLV